MARVGIDLDGVCYDFAGALRAYLKRDCGWDDSRMPEATQWEFYEDWGMTRAAFLVNCRHAIERRFMFWTGDPLPGTVDAIRRLADAGHDVVFVTDRGSLGKEAEKATRHWLWRWNIPFVELHFQGDKTTVPVDYFVDDRLENYDALDAAGVKVYLWDHPYNQDDTKERRRVSSWTQFLRAVGLTEEQWLNSREELTLPEPGEKAWLDDRSYVIGKDCCRPGTESLDEIPLEILKKYKLAKEASSDEVRVTSSTGGQKGQKLARFDLIPPKALWQVAELYGKGAEKYADHNWRKGYDWSLSYGALQRHAALFWSGEDIDPETGCPHMACVAFHALSLLTFMEEQRGFDNRFKSDAA